MKIFLVQFSLFFKFSEVTYCLRTHKQSPTLGLLSEQEKTVPSLGYPWWSYEFHGGAPERLNPWQDQQTLSHDKLFGNLSPTAPMDMLTNAANNWVQAAPQAPDGIEHISQMPAHKLPDIVDEAYPNFPIDMRENCRDSRSIELDNRHIVAAADRLRDPHKGVMEAFSGSPVWKQYPLQSPYDRHWPVVPVAAADTVVGNYPKFFSELSKRDVLRRDSQERMKAFKRADSDNDNMISWAEFVAEVQVKQDKSGEETNKLWEEFKSSSATGMTEQEFTKLAGLGFFPTNSLTQKAHELSTFVSTLCPVPLGYWGGITWCAENRPVVAVKIKVDNGKSADKAGLTGVEMKCGTNEFTMEEKLKMQKMGGSYNKTSFMFIQKDWSRRLSKKDHSENLKSNTKVRNLSSAESTPGVWSNWNECPSGTYVGGMKTKTSPFQQRKDNEGPLDAAFYCSKPISDTKIAKKDTILRFGTESGLSDSEKTLKNGDFSTKMQLAGWGTADTADYPKITERGWSAGMFCLPGTFACGMQSRVYEESGQDDMGITDFRMYCCKVVMG